jgi:hypothetical protein
VKLTCLYYEIQLYPYARLSLFKFSLLSCRRMLRRVLVMWTHQIVRMYASLSG